MNTTGSESTHKDLDVCLVGDAVSSQNKSHRNIALEVTHIILFPPLSLHGPYPGFGLAWDGMDWLCSARLGFVLSCVVLTCVTGVFL